MECGEVGVILTAVFIVLVLVIVTLVLVVLVLVIVITGILLILLILAVFGTIGGRKPNWIAIVVGDSSVFQDLGIVAFVLMIVIPSATDVDCPQNQYDAGRERVSSLLVLALTRVKASAKPDARARVNFIMVLEGWVMKWEARGVKSDGLRREVSANTTVFMLPDSEDL